MTRLLCDGCDKIRRFTSSPDGRTLLCIKCRVRYWWHNRPPMFSR